MAVLLPDRMLGVRRRAVPVTDSHGDHVSGSWGVLNGPWPGRAAEGGDVPVGGLAGRAWSLALDPAVWPLLQDDLVEEVADGGGVVRQWLVTSARLIRNNASSDVDYVSVDAHLRTEGSTRP